MSNQQTEDRMGHRNIHPEGWAPARGYANGIEADGTLYVGGQIGWTAGQVFEATDFVGQLEQALANIAEVVRTAGGEVEDVVRLTWFITDKREYMARQREVGAAYRRVFGKHFPAMSVVVVRELIEDAALVEIEATAVLRRDA
jgi:enamine deaminase RidA (YjgF/YER057c/UK114 family)